MSDKKVAIYHRPDWHPELCQILGDFIGQAGYITDVGTVRLLGPVYEDPDIPITKSSSEITGPTQILTAKSSWGI